MVYVLSSDRQTLMPTIRHGKVRRLLRDKKAKVIRRCPFTIKLLYDTTKEIQECNLGVDVGSKKVGFAVYENSKILYQSQLELRDDVHSAMEERKGHRRFRRFRKTRYRKAKFLNRKNSKKENRITPTIKSKVDSHIKEIEFIKSILPIKNLILETGQFDTQLMKNPNMNRHWGYQQGIDYGFESRKDYILHRDNFKCQLCEKEHTKLEVHHIIFRSQGGTNDENNLITLCSECHKKLHEDFRNGKEHKLKIKGKKTTLKYASYMNLIRSQLFKIYPNAIETFGFVTKANRYKLNIEKDHYLDACVIASGGNSFKSNSEVFYKKSIGCIDRQLTKGIRGETKLPKNKIFGFRQYDKVLYKEKEYFIKGRRTAGTCILTDIFNTNFKFEKPKCPKLIDCKKVGSRKSIIVERR